MDQKLIGVTFRAPATTATNMTFLPGGVLDPGYGGGGTFTQRVWVGSGLLKSITADPDSTNDYEIEVYDLRDANGVPIAASLGARYTLAAASATAQRSGYGGGGWARGLAFMDVTIPSAPAAIVANALRWKGTVQSLATTPPAVPFTDLDIECRSGLAIVLRPAGALTLDIDLSISYAPYISGAVRYQNAQRLSSIFA